MIFIVLYLILNFVYCEIRIFKSFIPYNSNATYPILSSSTSLESNYGGRFSDSYEIVDFKSLISTIKNDPAAAFRKSYCAKTNLEVQPWILIDLKKSYKIKSIRLKQNLFFKLKNFEVRVGFDTCNPLSNLNRVCYVQLEEHGSFYLDFSCELVGKAVVLKAITKHPTILAICDFHFIHYSTDDAPEYEPSCNNK